MITWCLKEAVPKHAFKEYSLKLDTLHNQIKELKKTVRSEKQLNETLKNYYSTRKKYIKAFDDLLAMQKEIKTNLAKLPLTQIIINALNYWEGKRLNNHAYCIMPNHVHWVVSMNENDEQGNPVYLQDILHSIKSFTGNQINKHLERNGTLWHKENFETTIRNEKHFMNAVNYTISNPVVAGFVKNHLDWKGTQLVSLNY